MMPVIIAQFIGLALFGWAVFAMVSKLDERL